jgi:predicted DNA-binding antitoxin AbrB/MazE fold protein
MTQVEAIYHNGVFQPMQDVKLPENQRVRLIIEPFKAADVTAWLADVQAMQKSIVEDRGYFPDSAISIAEDRMR